MNKEEIIKKIKDLDDRAFELMIEKNELESKLYALGEKNGKCQKRAMRIGIKILGEKE